MNKELNIFTLRMLREQYEAEHLDTEAEALNAAIEKFEQPEIIRCKDCKHYEADIMVTTYGVCCHSGWIANQTGHEVSESGWCYRAERRTDE